MVKNVKEIFKMLCEAKLRKAKMYAEIRVARIMDEIEDAVATNHDHLVTYILDKEFRSAIEDKQFDVYACEVEIIHRLKIDLGFKVEVEVKHGLDTIKIYWGEDVVGAKSADNIRYAVRPFSNNEPEELNGIELTGKSPA
jgi:hypothetical protein